MIKGNPSISALVLHIQGSGESRPGILGMEGGGGGGGGGTNPNPTSRGKKNT